VNDHNQIDKRMVPKDEVPPPTAPVRRRSRWLLRTVEFVAGFAGALLLGIMLVAVRLELGPIEVNWLTPMLVSYLGTQAAPLTVRIERTSLSWAAGRSIIDVVGSNLQLLGPADLPVIEVPKLSISVSLRALIKGELAATRVALIGPKVHIRRSKAGDIGVDLGADPSATEPATVRPSQSLKQILTGFAGKPALGASLGSLNHISILQADVSVDDQLTGTLWRFTDGEIDFIRISDGIEADLLTSLGLGDAMTHVFGHFRYASGTEQLIFSTSYDGIIPSHLAAVLPTAYTPLAELEMSLSGGIGGTINLATGEIGATQIRVEGGAGTLVDRRLAGGKLEVASVKLEAEYDPAQRRFKLDQFLLDLNGPTLELKGRADDLSPEAFSGAAPAGPIVVTAALSAHHLPIDRFGAIWPPDLASSTREWITSNLSVGSVDEVHADAALGIDLSGVKPIAITSLTGGMTVQGASVQYLRGLPRVEGVDSNIEFTAQRMDFAITGGHLKGLSVPQGTLVIDQFDTPVERMAIDLQITGPAEDVVTVLDAKPLQYAKAMGIDPAAVGGIVDGTLHFGFPLKNSLSFAEIDYGAKAQLVDLTIGHVALGHDLSHGTMALTLDPRSVMLQGTAKLDNVPAELSVTQRLSGTTGPRSEVHAKATLDDDARKLFDLDPIPEILQGPVGTQVIYSEFDGRRARAVVGLDLADATVTLKDVGWQKPPGQAGHTDFTAELVDGHLVQINDLVVHAPRLDAKASLTFADNKLITFQIPRLRLDETDAAVTVEHRGEPWRVGVQGPVIDLTGPLKQLDGAASAAHADKGPTVIFDLVGNKVILGPKRELRDVKFSATIGNHRFETGSLAAVLGKTGKASFRLDPVEDGGRFALATDDYGALMQAADISDNIVGGHLTVTGESKLEGDARRFTGHADGGDYHFTGAPFMFRLLSLASFQSIANLLTGDGIPFTTLKADLTLHEGLLTLNHAHTYGGAIGINIEGWFNLTAGTLSLDGTLVPAYTLNSVLGNLPVLGDLLLGGEGQGIFAANFRMGGKTQDPKISVNPLSPLAPGFIRHLFLFDAPDPEPHPKPPQ
jgi:hypothetical protein